MCLGAEARAQNKAARRQYKYENDRRERNWMQALSVYGTKKVQYETNVDAADMAVAQAYADEQEQKRNARGEAELKYEEMFRELAQNSEYSKILTSGGTGRSAARIGRMEQAGYGRKVAEMGRSLLLNDRKLERQTAQTVGEAQAYKQQQFAEVAFQPTPDLRPPQPVMRSVGAAAFMDALSIGSSVAKIAMPFVA